MFAVARFRGMCSRDDTLVVSCGLANFEQSSWSTHCRHELWGTHEELRLKEGLRQVRSQLQGQLPWNMQKTARSIWAIDCRRFDDLVNDRSNRKHSGRNPKITKSILESGNYHVVDDQLFRRYVSVLLRQEHSDHDLQERTNAESWSNTLTRCGRRQHSVSLLHLSDQDVWINTCAGNCSEYAAHSHSEFCKHTTNRSTSSVCDVFLCPTR